MIEPETIIDGRYRVISRLGSGGMADVYLAQDQLLGRDVAVKVLHEHFAEDHEFVERFRREASSAAALSHPNIVGIFDRGEWNGTYYIAMEYVAGRSLKTIVREEGALDPDRAIGIVVQILRAARFAHRRGVIHRDLKPHNVILDEENRARVTDFGIARAGASDMTMTGSIMGTAQYLSPEQAQGHSVTEPSDLYSIGVILYELLTGMVPFEGETAVAIAFKQVSAHPRPPSESNPAVPPSLDAVVMRAMAKDPAARFADAEEFIAVLERERALLPAYSGVTQAVHHVPAPAPADPPPAVGPLLMAPTGSYREDPGAGAPDRRRFLMWVLAVLLVAGLAALAVVLLLPSTTKVSVPDVRGQTQQSAGNTLRRAGLDPVATLEASTVEPTGLVISQTPAAGASADKGSRVDVVVSGGPSSAPLPSVTGLTASAAGARLRAAGFKPVTKDQNSKSVATGHVIGTEPAAETETHLGAHVTVLVSSGPAPVHVPDVTGQTLAAAEASLTNAGLALGTLTLKTNATQPAGTVLAQSPASGASVQEGAKVNLTVAQAPKEVAVPNVVGLSEALAAAALGEAGLKPKTVPATATTPAQEGQVLAQAPPPAAKVRKGSTVTIGVGVLGTPTTTTTTPATTPTTTPTTATPPAAP
jgi:eukaryotic-like serine/threonine-protein kinase